MAAENTFHFPKPGQRIVRSVIAVACCFCVFYLRNREGIPFYSALAVLQCIQPYQDSMAQVAQKKSHRNFCRRFLGTGDHSDPDVSVSRKSYGYLSRIHADLTSSPGSL